MAGTEPQYAFRSYVREDAHDVDRIQGILEADGVRVWRDTATLWPGEDWRLKIRQAISSDSLVFVACFSENVLRRSTSYQNEELLLAIEQLRLRQPDQPWLIQYDSPIHFLNTISVPAERSTRSTASTSSVTTGNRGWRDLSVRWFEQPEQLPLVGLLTKPAPPHGSVFAAERLRGTFRLGTPEKTTGLPLRR